MSANRTSSQNPVHFPSPGNTEEPKQDFSLRKLVKNVQFSKLLPEKNILILGKVGFFDLILTELKKSYQDKTGNKPTIISTEKELDKLIEKEKDVKLPIILVPAVDSQNGLNRLLTRALALKAPVWLVALPSQIHKHLLLSFNWFFISSSTPREIAVLANITPIANEDVDKLKADLHIAAIFAADQKIAKLGISERLGTVVYIHTL